MSYRVQQKTASLKIERDAYIFNTASGLLMALQSVIFLIVIMRVGDLLTAGIFTIAYANANLFLNVGKFGMRNYQASDVKQQYPFAVYGRSRVITSCAMMGLALVWLAYSAITVGYTGDKVLVIVWMCAFKLIDAIEDVYHGDYQQQGRLDIAAKALTVRLTAVVVMFVLMFVFTQNLLITMEVVTVFAAMFFVCTVYYVKRIHALPWTEICPKVSEVWLLLKDNFPIFISSFLLFYIGNAPKYAIDATMTDEVQALFGFISMPVFVVGLLAGFVYNPLVRRLALYWEEGGVSIFIHEVIKQCVVVLLVTTVCVLGAWLIGAPVLGLLYNTDLAPYLTDLLILVAGGGFYAYIGLFMTILTVLRLQKTFVVAFVITAVLAALSSSFIVEEFGIRGASWEYFVLTGLLTVMFIFLLIFGIAKKTNKANE